MTIAVLGTGMVGRAIVLDLAQDHSVTSFDLDSQNLELVKQIAPFISKNIRLSRYVHIE